MARVAAGAGGRIAIIMGSDSDLPIMQGACDALDKLELDYELAVVSAHRTPDWMAEFAMNAEKRGLSVIIAGAGGAAHFAGMVASYTSLPVIGVPVPVGPLQGQDALLSIVQMPKGIPVATVAIGGAYNAGLLAARILAHGGSGRDDALAARLTEYREQLRDVVRAKVV